MPERTKKHTSKSTQTHGAAKFGYEDLFWDWSASVSSAAPDLELTEFERRQFEEELYWEDYADRNDPEPPKKPKRKPPPASP